MLLAHLKRILKLDNSGWGDFGRRMSSYWPLPPKIYDEWPNIQAWYPHNRGLGLLCLRCPASDTVKNPNPRLVWPSQIPVPNPRVSALMRIV